MQCSDVFLAQKHRSNGRNLPFSTVSWINPGWKVGEQNIQTAQFLRFLINFNEKQKLQSELSRFELNKYVICAKMTKVKSDFEAVFAYDRCAHVPVHFSTTDKSTYTLSFSHLFVFHIKKPIL